MMGDDELAELRRRRMAQLQGQQMDQQQMEEEKQRAKSAMQMALMQILEPEARERLNTIRLTKPEFAANVEQQLVMLAQSGRIKQKISDAQLKDLLKQLIPAKKEFNIVRK
jgi:programmed cell death protein 5